MKTMFLFLFFFCFTLLFGQQNTDSIKLYREVIIKPTQKADLPAAINFFMKRKKESLAIKDTLNALYSIRLIAIGTYNAGDFFESEEVATEGLALVEGKQSTAYVNDRLGLYTQLGMVHRRKLDFKEAIKAYTLALTYSPSSAEQTRLLNNIANVYKSQGAFLQAKEYLLNALNVAETTENSELQAVVLDNLGEVLANLEDPKAINLLHQSLRLRLKINNLKHHYTSYMSLAEYYLHSNVDSSKYYAEKAISVSGNLQNVVYKKDALNVLMKLNPDLNVREHVHLSDSISTAIQLEENKYANRKWNVSLAEEQKALAEIEKEKERSKRILYQSIGISILLIAILLFVIVRLKHKRDRVQQVYKTETRISKKVHDEIANDLYKMMAKIQTAPGSNDALLDDLEAVYHKTRDISKEHSIINLDTDYGSLLIDLLQNYQSESVNVITKNITQINWSLLKDLKKRTLYRVLQELMTNMRKHSDASLVVVAAKQVGKKLEIHYTDNGVGGILKKGNGLLNTENRIRSMGGTLIFDSTVNKGVSVKIII